MRLATAAASRTDSAGLSLEQHVKAQSFGLGFDLVGIATLGAVETAKAFEEWLAAGYAGDMDYLPRGAGKRRDTRLPFSGARSAVVVGLNYGGTSPSGPIARYARGDDYHDVMLQKLDSLHRWLERRVGRAIPGRAYVDTGPILERDLARKAGLGWFGRNTMLINPRLGSFFFIGSLLVDLDLQPDAPFEAERCGTCTRCLDACPTGALVESGVMDARRCISYLTIEAKGAVPEELRQPVGELVYGCDICQDVCPFNLRFSRALSDAALEPHADKLIPSLQELMAMSPEAWREFSKRSPVKRAKRRGFLRNTAVALGNSGSAEAVPALAQGLTDAEPLVRGHAAWALGKIGTPAALEALRAQAGSEQDPWVLSELRSAVTALED